MFPCFGKADDGIMAIPMSGERYTVFGDTVDALKLEDGIEYRCGLNV